ncbi:MAG TPA: error-prone DNA polymerase [Planctomycetaceae bacterium]|nr:error-prone DNA polymerase [Planctomycetaceae bacterium]
MSGYVELHCKSNFSFLEGASHADELIARSIELGYDGIAITDRDTLAGVVRGHTAAKDLGTKFIVGAELHPLDGPPIVVWPTDRAAYGRLCRLITRGRLRREKGGCQLYWQDIIELSEGLLAGFLPRKPVPDLRPEADRMLLPDEEAFAWELDSTQLDSTQLDSTQLDSTKLRSPEFDGQASDLLVGNYRNTASEALGETEVLGRKESLLPSLDFEDNDDSGWLRWLGFFREIFGKRGYLLTSLHLGVDDNAKLDRACGLSEASGVPMVACGDVHYHVAERTLLYDCLLATRLASTIDQVASQRLGNAQFHLKPLDQLRQAFGRAPEAVARTLEIADQISFSLDDLRYDYPVELAPEGLSPIEYLKRLTWDGAKRRYPSGVPSKIIDLLKHEIGLIEELRYESYFLTVWDLVRFARSRDILCQGRGSAANSVVCFCLGITSVDPNRLDLLFERFISRERGEAPDIDVDFEHQRREEVLQYVYEKYGRHRAAMTATVITYRSRSALRDCGRALGISLDQIDELSKVVDSRGFEGTFAERCADCGIDPESDIGQRFVFLFENLVGFPRHLSQHVGGMVMTQDWLCEVCPLENAAMTDRTVIQWDKDDLDELGILKVDCLSLGMLSAIHRCFDMLSDHYDRPLTLASVPAEDPDVYDMICRADTVGVFQIESRAQMSMLPRLRPRCFYDLVIEVAIVRPGPIQGQMVHPYLKARRTGVQPQYPNEEIQQVLEKTMGVPIFQEQAMRLAVVAAGFSPGEADQLRRAMAAFRRKGVIAKFHEKLISGMRSNGLSEEFAERVYTQLKGFGEYGFPESHAASFALLVYVSCWLKHHYPAAFCASILNSLPMGFYGPAQLVADAKQHGVTVLPIDVNYSHWECTLEKISGTQEREPENSAEETRQRRSDAPHKIALRLGMQMVRGLQLDSGMKIESTRVSGGRFSDLSDFKRRTSLGQGTLNKLADAGALNDLTGDRRAAYWQTLAQEKSASEHSLLNFMGADDDEELPNALSPIAPIEEVYADYETTGLSLRAHPVSFVREQLDRLRVTTANELQQTPDGKFVRVAGLVVLRQRPSTAKGITFVTLEDETGSMNLVMRPDVWQRHFRIARTSNAWLVYGACENRENIIHISVGRIEDLSTSVEGLTVRSRDFQ